MEKVKICVPITGKNETEIRQQAADIAGSAADMVEWRFDLAEELYRDTGAGEAAIAALLPTLRTQLSGKALLFTIRTKTQGGCFPADPAAYRRLCEAALRQGIDYMDLEDTTEQADVKPLITRAHAAGAQVIASFHDFGKTPSADEILLKLRALSALGADILKTAYMPEKRSDVAALLYATARFREEDRDRHPLITMSMGKLGEISRLIGGAFGSVLTFASVGEVSAPGQLPAEKVGKILRELAPYTAEGAKMKKNYTTVLFDLDGTIMDSGPGIMKSVQYALDHFGYKNEPEEKLRKFVGPSLMDSFTEFYGMDIADAECAVALYREVYPTKGIFDAVPYDGIEDVFRAIRDSGRRLVLVTSKPHVFAERILEHFGFSDYFCFQTGPELSDHDSRKARLINRAVNALQLKKDECIMIGDRHFDMEGAVEAGVDALGVTYGYGDLEEITEAGADYIAHSPREILTVLGISE